MPDSPEKRGVWFAKNPHGNWIQVGESSDSHYIGFLDISYGWTW